MEIIKRKGESYQHAAARTVMMNWLSNRNTFGQLNWQGKVWEEYPFIKGKEGQCLSECDLPIFMSNPPIPTYEELAASNIYPVAIADIAIVHKGTPVYAIEIVHKNEISEEKIEKLKKLKFVFDIEIWRVEAHWILAQVDFPSNFPEYGIRRVA